MNPLYKSQINLGDLIAYPIFYALLVVYPTWAILECSDTIKYMVVGSFPIFCYVIWCLFINVYYFYEDKIKIVYIFRLTRREEKRLYYTPILKKLDTFILPEQNSQWLHLSIKAKHSQESYGLQIHLHTGIL